MDKKYKKTLLVDGKLRSGRAGKNDIAVCDYHQSAASKSMSGSPGARMSVARMAAGKPPGTGLWRPVQQASPASSGTGC